MEVGHLSLRRIGNRPAPPSDRPGNKNVGPIDPGLEIEIASRPIRRWQRPSWRDVIDPSEDASQVTEVPPAQFGRRCQPPKSSATQPNDSPRLPLDRICRHDLAYPRSYL